MPSFFDKPFEEQVKGIIKAGDLKLLQALIGTRSLIGLSMYCSSFFFTKTVIAQAKYQSYSALLNVLTEYKKSENEIFVDRIKNTIGEEVTGNEGRLRQNILLPLSSNKLKSLTNNNYSDPQSDLKKYIRETDLSSLCTFNTQRVIGIYHNYISNKERRELENVLLEARESEDKYVYIEKAKEEYLKYNDKIRDANGIIKHNELSLIKIKNQTFFDEWYEELLQKVVNEARESKKHLLYKEIAGDGSNVVSKLGTSFNKEIMRRVINELLDNYIKTLADDIGVKSELLSLMRCVDIDDPIGKMNYKTVNRRIISRADELTTSEIILQRKCTSNQQNSMGEVIEKGLAYISDNMHVYLLSRVEQEMLNEIAEIAANYRERDNKKKDLELLAVCNGGEFKNELLLPTDLGFSEIERLYKDMLSIEFKERGEHESHKLLSLRNRLPLLELEEIKEAFHISITDDILSDIEESLDKYVEVLKKTKEDMIGKVFGKQENIATLSELE
ncbi:hypothetical protein [Wolbachia endosymbiont of Pentidionis agamae]|uniref:hypothetical protein n=1 Tax=Wolbachia endosymbiont of Pentidionis agamae TaxID=3110435 RepID=UPI002FCE9165